PRRSVGSRADRAAVPPRPRRRPRGARPARFDRGRRSAPSREPRRARLGCKILRMRRPLRLLPVVLAGAGACAPQMVPAPFVTTPKYPEFVVPALPPGADGAAVLSEDRGWRFLQTGDLKNAVKEFETALHIAPAFHPAETSLGYVELANKDPKAALAHFERSLTMQAGEVSALVGQGQALVALNREADAVAAFEEALAADPSLADIRRQTDVLKFRA